MSDPDRFVIGHGRSNVNAPAEASPLISLVGINDKQEQRIRRLQARLEDAEIHNKRLRRELDRTKAELELVTHERDTALLRLAELGEDL